MTTTDASTRGRRNRANGADCERKVARYLRAWYPDAERFEKNGWRTPDHTSEDPGDIDKTSPGLWWSVKNCQEERTNAWLSEMREKQGERLGILVVRRRGHASPGEWWVWMSAFDLRHFLTGDFGSGYLEEIPVRVELGHLMRVLVQANYAPTPKAEVA